MLPHTRKTQAIREPRLVFSKHFIASKKHKFAIQTHVWKYDVELFLTGKPLIRRRIQVLKSCFTSMNTCLTAFFLSETSMVDACFEGLSCWCVFGVQTMSRAKKDAWTAWTQHFLSKIRSEIMFDAHRNFLSIISNDFDETWPFLCIDSDAKLMSLSLRIKKSALTHSHRAWNAQVTLETQSKCIWKHAKTYSHVFLQFYFQHSTFWKNGPILRNASNVARTFTFRDWSWHVVAPTTTILAYLGNIYGSRILRRNSAWNHLECGLNYACGFAFYKLRMRCRTKYQRVWLRRSGKILLHTRKTREQRENYDLFLHVLHHLKKAQVRNPNTRLKSMA